MTGVTAEPLSAGTGVHSPATVCRRARVGIDRETVGPTSTEPMLSKRSDGALMQAVAAGSEDAYAELYRRHRPSVMAVAKMILGDGPAVDDVIAEVFVGLWRFPEQFDPTRGSFLGYLRLKTRGRSIDIVRSERSRKRREDKRSFLPPGLVMDTEATVVASEAAAQLRRVVASLSPLEREVIQLAFFTDMSYRAVATYLRIPEGTVKGADPTGVASPPAQRRTAAPRQRADEHGADRRHLPVKTAASRST